MNQARLVIEGRGNWNHTHLIGETAQLKIGRGSKNELDLNDLHASSQHAVITQRDDGHYIRDLSSRNGTFVNGEKVQEERKLSHGDQIKVGVSNMTFLIESEDSFAPTTLLNASTSRPALTPWTESDVRSRPEKSTVQDLERELRESQAAYRRLKTSNEFLRELVGRPSPLHMLGSALRFMTVQVGAENGFIMQIDPRDKKWTVRARFGEIVDWSPPPEGEEAVQLPMSLTAVEQVIKTAQPVISFHTLEDPRFDSAKSVSALGIHSCLCHPLLSDGAAVGVTYVDRRMNREPFSRREEALFQSLTEELNRILYPEPGPKPA